MLFMFRFPRRLFRTRNLLLLLVVAFPLLLETIWHIRSHQVQRPAVSIDVPFVTGCIEPDISAPRENATLLMLARNEDLEGAKFAVSSIEAQFNRWFNYPYVFLNDKPWSEEFKKEVGKMASGTVTFETLDARSWGFPETINVVEARKSLVKQGKTGLPYAGMESYHHMCRFYSGKFYDHPALSQYRWFWRIEPDVRFACAMPYDPFRKMRENKKTYGYAISLWEVGSTSPTLFRAVADYKAALKLKTNNIWRAMVEPSYAPWPIRKFLSWFLYHRTAEGAAWNHCHFWSNFEIADLDFFRSERYRDFFDYLDRLGGFYFERWGDAPVHSLAAALFLEPSELHRFEDIGYEHAPFYTCPINAKGKQLYDSKSFLGGDFSVERDDGLGCRCTCQGKGVRSNFADTCLARFDQALRSR